MYDFGTKPSAIAINNRCAMHTYCCKYHFHIQIYSRNYMVETGQILKYVVDYAQHLLNVHLLLVRCILEMQFSVTIEHE